MIVRTQKTGRARRGVALIVTLIFVALFACMAVAVASMADTNTVISRNRINADEANALAETGLQLIQHHIGGLAVPGTHWAYDLHRAIGEHLSSAFQGSNMLNPAHITYNVWRVTVPTILLLRPDGTSGTIDVTIEASGGVLDNTTVTITSTGRFSNAVRTATYNLTVQRGQSVFDNYGIASKSAIQMTGNATLRAASTGTAGIAEATMLSATYSTNQAIRLVGNINVGDITSHTNGDVVVCNPSGTVVKTGNVKIGRGTTIGASEPQWPTVDVTPFRTYATNPQLRGTSSNTTLTNIIIPPNTNPTFSGNTTINGVVYIQAPNNVKFSGNVDITGCIVCEPPAVDNLVANQVQFTGNVTTRGVDQLPAGAQFDGLRDMTGSFLLAPGYAVSFTGNFNTVNGCMVGSSFKFTGNAGGTIKGGVVNLSDSTFQISGNAPIIIDKNGFPASPAGLSSSFKLVCVSGSYAE